jgi:DNA-binding transcriptional LysR family regulator
LSFKRDHLRYFVAVADEGQMTRAAKRLSIAQPALSQAISQLEAELGLKLLDRHPRGVHLTAAGSAFLEKAREVVASEQSVMRTAELLARSARGQLSVGFVGPPPRLTHPELFAALDESHPDAMVSFRDLPFPCGATSSWLEGVDVAICHAPADHQDVCVQSLRADRRVLIVSRRHELAAQRSIRAEQAFEERFISYHPNVQPEWAAFHCLDDHRGAPPPVLTGDEVATTLQMLGVLGANSAVTTLPDADGQLVRTLIPDVVAVPIRDARPASISLVWRDDEQHPLVLALARLAAARSAIVPAETSP